MFGASNRRLGEREGFEQKLSCHPGQQPNRCRAEALQKQDLEEIRALQRQEMKEAWSLTEGRWFYLVFIRVVKPVCWNRPCTLLDLPERVLTDLGMKYGCSVQEIPLLVAKEPRPEVGWFSFDSPSKGLSSTHIGVWPPEIAS